MRTIGFLLLPEFSCLGIAAATEPLFVANWLAQQRLFDWTLVSVDGKPVRASNGMLLPVDGDMRVADGCRTVFVLASFEPHQAARDRRVLRWLKRISRFGVQLGGIENGSVVLAAAGLLDGRPVAVHWDNLIGFAEAYPATRPVAKIYTLERDRITCAGGAAILDLMLAWIGSHGDGTLAGEVAEHLLVGAMRPAEARQRDADPAPADPDAAVARAAALMLANVEEPLTCREVARRAGLSLRQMERRFQRVFRCSVLQKYRLIRMTKAHQLLQQTHLSVTQVALACGFASPEYFCRLYRGLFDRSPSKDRRQSTTAPVLRAAPRARG